ncbi:hypothetical protein RT99_07830 [Flavobacterium sp. MEB061]|uniref:hypothetical protein n=1 Tax=Flavobacterium sp. MEB061 TaxID=1587524 RepID=UPI0005AC63A3|nr:hypothetical protein [Flavobacterium sp. MEB061]KIQ22101.1 hypothetical protein RT99_07830 [Flavobacterium sp. MEB061]
MEGKIQVGYLVSYDYELLKNAIPTVYSDSDTVFLAIDSNRKTWKGQTIEIKEDFFKWIEDFDTQKKIVIYEEEFYIQGLTAMECEIRERKMLAHKMGIGNWLIQLDSDEYFYDFRKFVSFLKAKNDLLINPENKIVQICGFKINLYKYVEEGVLYVDKLDKFMIATNYPNYKIGRHAKCRSIYTDSVALHDCLSRSREDLVQKIENWGHNDEINKNEFMSKWDSVSISNYKQIRGFFYLDPMHWKTLEFMKGNSLQELLSNFKLSNKINIGKFFLLRKNFGQWFKFLMKKKIKA